MAQEYTGHVKEKGTFVIQSDWKDDAGAATTPTAATWTLTDEDGTVINSREDVVISSLSTTNYIVTTGDDNALQSATDNGKRVVTVEFTYTSDRGSGLKGKDEYIYWIENLLNVT